MLSANNTLVKPAPQEKEHGYYFPLDLTRQDGLFDIHAWAAAFIYADEGVRAMAQEPEQQLTVHLRDLYFCKKYQVWRDFNLVEEAFSHLGVPRYELLPPDDWKTKHRVSVSLQNTGHRLTLAEQEEQIILSFGGCSSQDLAVIKQGRFPNPPAIFTVERMKFLLFLAGVASLLRGDGELDQARVNLDVQGRGFLIRARRVNHAPMPAGLQRLLNTSDMEKLDWILESTRQHPDNYQKIWLAPDREIRTLLFNQLRRHSRS